MLEGLVARDRCNGPTHRSVGSHSSGRGGLIPHLFDSRSASFSEVGLLWLMRSTRECFGVEVVFSHGVCEQISSSGVGGRADMKS